MADVLPACVVGFDGGLARYSIAMYDPLQILRRVVVDAPELGVVRVALLGGYGNTAVCRFRIVLRRDPARDRLLAIG